MRNQTQPPVVGGRTKSIGNIAALNQTTSNKLSPIIDLRNQTNHSYNQTPIGNIDTLTQPPQPPSDGRESWNQTQYYGINPLLQTLDDGIKLHQVPDHGTDKRHKIINYGTVAMTTGGGLIDKGGQGLSTYWLSGENTSLQHRSSGDHTEPGSRHSSNHMWYCVPDAGTQTRNSPGNEVRNRGGYVTQAAQTAIQRSTVFPFLLQIGSSPCISSKDKDDGTTPHQ